MKAILKSEAIELRKNGYTYSEILKQIPVSKSTLSLWLRSVSLSRRQFQRITKKKLAAQQRGGDARKREKLERSERIISAAVNEIQAISMRELWLIGIALYWAEGSKEKSSRGHQTVFTNSDPKMVKIFIKWVNECLGLSPNQVIIELYLHQMYQDSLTTHLEFWNQILGMQYNMPKKVYFKKNKLSSKRHINVDYHGQLRIVIRNSTDLNRKIKGWTDGICRRCGVV